jgi:hypothetical protein
MLPQKVLCPISDRKVAVTLRLKEFKGCLLKIVLKSFLPCEKLFPFKTLTLTSNKFNQTIMIVLFLSSGRIDN